MADNTSAGIFGELFAFADERNDLLLIEKLWLMSGNYDFSPEDAVDSKVLARIDVIRIGWDSDYGEWIHVYKTSWESEFDAAQLWAADFDWDQPGPVAGGAG